MVSCLGIRNEDYKTLDSGYAFTAPAYFLNVNFVLFTFFYRLWTEACRTTPWTTELSLTLIISHSIPSFFLALGAFVKRI